MKETDIQRAILEALTWHPQVEFLRRYNAITTPVKLGGKTRWVSSVFAAKGVKFKQIDLMGMLKNGKLLAIEVKRPGETPTDEQWEEINRINRTGGLAFWADSVEMAQEQMDIGLQALPSNYLI